MKYVVDTHALLWFLSGSSQLSLKAKAVLSSPESHLILPAIVLAESLWIVRRRKNTKISAELLLRAVNEDKRIEICSLDKAIVERTISLTTINEMHDRQIVATALELADSGEDVALLTCDRNITEATLVSILW